MRTVVIGGGVAGLLAARRRLLAGDHVTVLEATDALGGAVASAEVAGLEINTGAEAFSIASGSVAALLDELGLGAQVVSPAAGRGSRLVSDAGSLPSPRGGLLGIPGRPLSPAVREVLGRGGAVRAWAERFLPASWGLRPGVTIGAYVRARMGRRAAERLVAPVVGGVHSADPETLELAAIQPRLPAAVREHGSLAAAVRALRPASASAGTAVASITPTMAELPRALARDLTERGAELRTASAVTALARDDNAWQVHIGGAVPDAEPEIIDADRVILAVDPDVAARLLAPALPEVAEAIPEAPSAPVRLVALVLDAPALDAAPSGTGALVAPGTRAVRAKALTHASAKWDHVREAARALGEHVHVIRLSYGRPGEELPEDGPALIARALADASAILGTELTQDMLRGHRVITWDRAMRQMKPGHRDALARLDALLHQRADDLELVGSWRDGTGLDAIARAEAHRTTTAPVAP